MRIPFGPEDQAIHKSHADALSVDRYRVSDLYRAAQLEYAGRAERVAGVCPPQDFTTPATAAPCVAHYARIDYLSGQRGATKFAMDDTTWATDGARQNELRDAVTRLIGNHVDVAVVVTPGPNSAPGDPMLQVVVIVTPK